MIPALALLVLSGRHAFSESPPDSSKAGTNLTIVGKNLYLSSIFKWYKKDFPKDLHSYLQQYAESGLNEQLQAAKDKKYQTRYQTYDWSLNARDDEEKSGGSSH